MVKCKKSILVTGIFSKSKQHFKKRETTMIWRPNVKQALGMVWEIERNSECSYRSPHESVTRD